MNIDRNSLWRFALLDCAVENADAVVDVTARITLITSQAILTDTLGALWEARNAPESISPLAYETGVKSAWKEYLYQRQFSNAPGARRFGSDSMISSQSWQDTRVNGGSITLYRGGVSQADPVLRQNSIHVAGQFVRRGKASTNWGSRIEVEAGAALPGRANAASKPRDRIASARIP